MANFPPGQKEEGKTRVITFIKQNNLQFHSQSQPRLSDVSSCDDRTQYHWLNRHVARDLLVRTYERSSRYAFWRWIKGILWNVCGSDSGWGCVAALFRFISTFFLSLVRHDFLKYIFPNPLCWSHLSNKRLDERAAYFESSRYLTCSLRPAPQIQRKLTKGGDGFVGDHVIPLP